MVPSEPPCPSDQIDSVPHQAARSNPPEPVCLSGVHLWRQDQARGGVYKALLQQRRGSPGRSHLHLPPAGIPPDQQPPVLAALGSTPPRASGPTGNTARVALSPPLGASGAMDNASDYGSEDCRFDSCLARHLFGASVRLAWSRFLSFAEQQTEPAWPLSPPVPPPFRQSKMRKMAILAVSSTNKLTQLFIHNKNHFL